MGEIESGPHAGAKEELAEAVERLECTIGGDLRVSAKHVLFDLAVVDFSAQVLEGAKATVLLCSSEVPRVSWAAVRQAFEATHDLFFLLELCPDRLQAGAQVYVGALHGIAVTRGKLDRAAFQAKIEGDEPLAQPGFREFVRQEAEEIEGLSVGSRSAILEALEHRLEGGDRHWSGLPRRQMTKKILDLPDARGLGAMLEAYYDALSVRAHPRLRIGDGISLDGGSVRVHLSPDEPDHTPCQIALACILTVEALLATHEYSAPSENAL